MRELVQCDIDIIGSDSIYCETELINVTAKALLAIGLKNFKVRINDRSILRNVLLSAGFKHEELDSVCITFDKLDKIGVDGIRNELAEKRFDAQSISALNYILQDLPVSLEHIKSIIPKSVGVNNLEKLISEIKLLSGDKYDIEFDLSLVRGQGYYTGTVFEIESSEFNSSIAGGGRYDNLIGKFTNERVPAVGFSIGFERIFSILSDSGFAIPNSRKRVAVFFENNFAEANKRAEELRSSYDVALFEKPKKLSRFLNSLQEKGYYGFAVCGQSEEIRVFE